jgi:hypothetical protein
LDGFLWDASCPFMLEALPYDWESGFYNTHFVKASNQYNNILSLGGVGIDNERMTTGWDVIMGAHSVRLAQWLSGKWVKKMRRLSVKKN